MGDRLVRDDLCTEAIRLGASLRGSDAATNRKCMGLLALMLLIESRGPLASGRKVSSCLLADQDRTSGITR